MRVLRKFEVGDTVKTLGLGIVGQVIGWNCENTPWGYTHSYQIKFTRWTAEGTFAWEATYGEADLELYQEPQTQCECGKDKHGFANHSRWCPKAEV